MEVDISDAVQVSGWMRPEELEWLARQASTRSRILEVGSYHGRSTIAMLDNSEAHIWCVDRWATKGVISNADYRLFLLNTERYAGRLTIMRGEGTEMLSKLRDEGVTFDMAFVDDGHDYSFVCADILGCLPLLAPDGLLCGHDYSRRWPGVVRAVDELVPGFKRVKGTALWWK